MDDKTDRIIAIGGSAGSLDVLITLFSRLPKKFIPPIIVIVHMHPRDDGGVVQFFKRRFLFPIKEAVDKEAVQSGTIYFPPANYHLLLERDRTFSLSVDARVNFSRPSIDVFFESAAVAWGSGVTAILLTGASSDGANGMRAVKNQNGRTVVQDPRSALYPLMPRAAIDTGQVDSIYDVDALGLFLSKIVLQGDGLR